MMTTIKNDAPLNKTDLFSLPSKTFSVFLEFLTFKEFFYFRRLNKNLRKVLTMEHSSTVVDGKKSD